MNQIIIKVNNVNARLLTTDEDLKEKLSETLKFRPPGYEHNAAFLAHRWDGWKYFFNKKSGLFLAGILPEIQLALEIMKKDYTLVDERTTQDWAIPSIGDQFLNQWLPKGKEEITLHDFQPDLVNNAIRHGRGIIQAPTSAGKTYIMISLLKCLPPKTPVLFLTKSASLVHQNWEDMKLWGVENLGRWYGKFKQPNYVMCITCHQKTFESLENLLPKFKVLIVDEVHECMSDVPVSAFRKMKAACCRFGISATAFKWEKEKINDCAKWELKGHFGCLLKTETTKSGFLTTQDLKDRGIVSESEAHFYKVTKPDIAYEPYMDAIKLGVEQNFHFHDMVAKIAKHCPGRTLIVVERIEHGRYLNQLIPGSSFLYGDLNLKQREPILNALKDEKGGRYIGIIQKRIITAGINLKIHDLINAAGGEAAHNVIQLIGRGLRLAGDKDKLRYHDFLFLNNSYLQEDAEWRIKVLEKEGHPVTIHDNLDHLGLMS